MSIFTSILSKIFPPDHPAVKDAAPAAGAPPLAPAAPNDSQPPAKASMPPVNVEQVLQGLSDKHGGSLNWRTSIVDLMKLLGLDSSLANRQQLAAELHYAGDSNDSAAMNLWLHKQVMTKLSDNGGTVPEDLKH